MSEQLWTPGDVSKTAMMRFRDSVNAAHSLELASYEDLYRWSIDNIEMFWQHVWSFTGIVSSKQSNKVIDLTARMDSHPTWFEGARLNWAENQLQSRDPNKTAIIECTEPLAGASMDYRKTSYAELYDQVHLLSIALKSLGLKEGQVLGYYGPNCAASIIFCLAATSLGAIWSSTGADFGAPGVIERFGQFGDKLWGVVGAEAVRYNGKKLPHKPKFEQVVKALSASTSVKAILFDYLQEEPVSVNDDWLTIDDLFEIGKKEKGSQKDIEFAQLPFDHPLWVLFSSGTTGKPKAIVHRAGGMLIQAKKEHVLHGDMGPGDIFFYYTSANWMMWNYLVSGLSTGCTIVMFDGSPLFKPSLLWDMSQELGVTVFGTSAKYIDVLSKSYSPNKHHPLPALRQILSTGSPLRPDLFDWVYDNIKKDLVLGSITGGTDICSLFGAHNVCTPVYRGEIQCLGLGMAVESWSDEGKPVPRGEAGELVCTKPFPCAPVFFWNDSNGEKYKASYYEKFDGVWAHGDFCVVTPSREGNGGGLIMLGRSDGVLNPSGVRFGSSEIYEVLETLAPSATTNKNEFNVVEDTLVVGQKIQGGSDERVVLFVKLEEGASLSDALLKEIKTRVRTQRSARHVPERILQVKDIPHTVNGKKVEVPVKKILVSCSLSAINRETLRNPECLDEYVELAKTLQKEVK